MVQKLQEEEGTIEMSSGVSSSILSFAPPGIRRSLQRARAFFELKWAVVTHKTDPLLRRRFNHWAETGRTDSMERNHPHLAKAIIDRMDISPEDRILDVACGSGWFCRLLADVAGPKSQVRGLDISDSMIKLAKERSTSYPNVSFHCGSSIDIPGPANFLTKIVSIEAFYYFDKQEQVMRNLLHATAPGGRVCILMCQFSETAKSTDWIGDNGLPVHNLSAAQYEEMFKRAGWGKVRSEMIDFKKPEHGALSAAALKDHDRAILVFGTKLA